MQNAVWELSALLWNCPGIDCVTMTHTTCVGYWLQLSATDEALRRQMDVLNDTNAGKRSHPPPTQTDVDEEEEVSYSGDTDSESESYTGDDSDSESDADVVDLTPSVSPARTPRKSSSTEARLQSGRRGTV